MSKYDLHKTAPIEAQKCAILDSACSSTVCGEMWLKDYIESLDDKDKGRIKFNKSDKIFKFGGGERLSSVGQFKIPITLAGKQLILVTDVVKSDLPLLLSKKGNESGSHKIRFRE